MESPRRNEGCMDGASVMVGKAIEGRPRLPCEGKATQDGLVVVTSADVDAGVFVAAPTGGTSRGPSPLGSFGTDCADGAEGI